MKLTIVSLALIPIIGGLNSLLGFSSVESLNKSRHGPEPTKSGSVWAALPPGTFPPVPVPPAQVHPYTPPVDKDSYDIPDPQPKPPIPKPPIPKPPEPNPPNPDPPIPQGPDTSNSPYRSDSPFWKNKKHDC